MGDIQAGVTRSRRRKCSTKVKTGCKTCKIRRLKCDESRPACHRCVSTGRICDGYGVWGGGSGGVGSSYGQCQSTAPSNSKSIILQPQASVSFVTLNAEERQHFEWFRLHTAQTIPRPFVLNFWDTLLLQASQDEPAVMHAILTLSSIHKEGIINSHNQVKRRDIPDKQEKFMLHQYTKAIHHLQPYLSTKAGSSVRVALITCAVFICLELLRGRFRTAQTHLGNGLNLLQEWWVPSRTCDDGSLPLKPRELIDNWIAELFSRLHLQVMLFGESDQHPSLILCNYFGSRPTVSIYHSLSEAWKSMERILNRISYLAQQRYRLPVLEFLPFGYSSPLIQHQQSIQADLTQWLRTYNASRKHLESHDPERILCHMLDAYYSMAAIMVATCLAPDDELSFDSYVKQFISILNRSVHMRKIKSSSLTLLPLPGNYINMVSYGVGVGCIPPLYYTALKCRIHRVRLQAIRLLESTSHREGLWDARIIAYIARKVMEIEEGDFYKDVETADDFLLYSFPELHDLSLPIIPQSHRVKKVKVVLPDSPMDSVLLSYRQKQPNGDWTLVRKEYHLP